MAKAPHARETLGLNPTDRKKGGKRYPLVAGRGVRLSIIGYCEAPSRFFGFSLYKEGDDVYPVV